MMNYLWAGLILVSFLFAIGGDANDLRTGRYRNGRSLAVDVIRPATSATDDREERVDVRIPRESWADYFGREPAKAEDATLPATVVRAGERVQLQLTAPTLPEPLGAIRKFHDADAKMLAATLLDPLPREAGSARVRLAFEPVRFARLKAINDAAVQFAQTAFQVALSLVGGLALWLGLLQIADDSGLVNVLVRVIRPVLRPLFPDVPDDSPALGLIALNVAANMLALGNAATPIGIKAMQELQRLNPTKDTATNAMVMLLAINTAGVTLLPSPSLVGSMGPRIGLLMGPIILTTGISLAIAILTCKLLEGRRRGRDAATPGA